MLQRGEQNASFSPYGDSALRQSVFAVQLLPPSVVHGLVQNPFW